MMVYLLGTKRVLLGDPFKTQGLPPFAGQQDTSNDTYVILFCIRNRFILIISENLDEGRLEEGRLKEGRLEEGRL